MSHMLGLVLKGWPWMQATWVQSHGLAMDSPDHGVKFLHPQMDLSPSDLWKMLVEVTLLGAAVLQPHLANLRIEANTLRTMQRTWWFLLH